MSKQADQQPGPNITLLKWIVGILGVLIVIFTAVIAVTIFQRLTATDTGGTVAAKKKAETAAAMPAAEKGKLPRFGDIRLPVPDDMDVIDMTASAERLFLTLGTEGAARLVLVIDLTDGRVLGSINLEKNGIQQ